MILLGVVLVLATPPVHARASKVKSARQLLNVSLEIIVWMVTVVIVPVLVLARPVTL
jgi:hypothetical protein